MPLPLIVLAAAAASFACEGPSHHDGDNLRCRNVPGSMRLQGIDAPEMPGACRPDRRCVDGDPFAARDYLRGLTAGKTLQCVQEDTDNYDRRIVNCTAGTVNISCAMIESGHAVPRYAPLDCSGPSAAPETAPDVAVESPTSPTPQSAPEPPPVIVPADMPARPGTSGLAIGFMPIAFFALLLINLITWVLFAIDKRRAQAGRSRERIAESTLLGWALVGGSPAAWLVMNRLRHKSAKDSFKQPLLLISGLQIGAVIGGLYLWFTG
jgi:uncharacterized membrane protein YsdA (DUF1294 family)